MSSTLGQLFKITTFGESHGNAVGVVLDGVPANIALDFEKIKSQLARRRPGQSSISSPRNEMDEFEVLSGLEDYRTLGSPLTLIVKNKDIKPDDYKFSDKYRPSHADYTTQAKYGIKAKSGGGRSSARETVARVLAGAVAEQLIQALYPELKIIAFVDSVYNDSLAQPQLLVKSLSRNDVDKFITRCPDASLDKIIFDNISKYKELGDSLGGTIFCSVINCPPGLGEPIFNKLNSALAQAILSIPSCKGIEFGTGFKSAQMLGSEHNDEFVINNNQVRTKTNHSGGIQGGISNGEDISFRAVFKPVSTIQKSQNTVNIYGEQTSILAQGRHDPCVVPRAVPIVESMTAIVLLDLLLIHRSKSNLEQL